MEITISKSRNGNGTITTSQTNYNILKNTTLQGCPFLNYNAWELLQDLISMYSWKLKNGKAYNIREFLTLCNDIHAELYKYIFVD